MAKPKLMEMRIRPSDNGGHNVLHEYHASPKYTKGSSGGMMMDRPEGQEFNFGPKDGNALIQHIGQALALKGMQQGEESPGE